MKLVIDTNILMAGLLKDSIVRKVLSSENIQFFIPEYALNEIHKYKGELAKKSGMSGEEINEITNLLLENIEIISKEKIKSKLKEAESIMKGIDLKDSVFIAAALTIKSDGIWSFDNDFKRQTKIRIYDVTELVRMI
jgi:predicted nucleic acid-binding protein